MLNRRGRGSGGGCQGILSEEQGYLKEIPSNHATKAEVASAATEAVAEAKRCLNCPKPLCKTGCPIENEIPSFNHALSIGNVGEAY